MYADRLTLALTDIITPSLYVTWSRFWIAGVQIGVQVLLRLKDLRVDQ